MEVALDGLVQSQTQTENIDLRRGINASPRCYPTAIALREQQIAYQDQNFAI